VTHYPKLSLIKCSNRSGQRGVASIELALILPIILVIILCIRSAAQVMQVNITVNHNTRTAAWREAQFEAGCQSILSILKANEYKHLRASPPNIDCEKPQNDWQQMNQYSMQYINEASQAGTQEAGKAARSGRVKMDSDISGYSKIILAAKTKPDIVMASGEMEVNIFNGVFEATFTPTSRHALDIKSAWLLKELKDGYSGKLAPKLQSPTKLFHNVFPSKP
jgi:hypothetical protein